MDKILIQIKDDSFIISKYEKNINELEINNTNVIDVNKLKFTCEYIENNLDLVSTFLNLLILKFKIVSCIILNNDIACTILKVINNIPTITKIIFNENKILSYSICSFLTQNNNLNLIDCYDIPQILFNKFDSNILNTRCEVHSTSSVYNINSIKTTSDVYNKNLLIVPALLNKEDIEDIMYLLSNNSSIKKIIFMHYSKINLNTFLSVFRKYNKKKIDVLIIEDDLTTFDILKDIKEFGVYNKKFNVNIKIKYSKKYLEKNKFKQLNYVFFRNILLSLILILIIYLTIYFIKNNIDKNNSEKNIGVLKENKNLNNLEETKIQKTSKENEVQSITGEKKINTDISMDEVGWLKIKNTNIDYPVLQYSDNEYYLTHSYDKSINSYGWIYVDYRNDLNNLNKNTIVYGHSMAKGLMFSTLENVLNPTWYSNNDNLIINFSINGNNYKWKIFSVYTIEKSDDYLVIDFNSKNEFRKFLDMIIERSIIDFDDNVSIEDKLLTLSTCYKDEKHRIVVHAYKLM